MLSQGMAWMAAEPRPTGVRRAGLAYVCTQVGAGLLALAPAVAHVGWLGVLLIVLCALTAAYTSMLLGATMGRVAAGGGREGAGAGEPLGGASCSPSYEDIGEQALGKAGRRVSQLLQWLMLVGVCTIFLVLVALNAQELEKIAGVAWLSKRQVVLCAALAELLPCVLFPTVKETFWLTALGAFCSALCAAVVVVESFRTDSRTVSRCADIGVVNSWPVYLDFQGLCLCWNTVVFAFGGINVLPSLLADFHRRGVLERALVSFAWRSYGIIIGLYVAVAVAGFAVGGVAMSSHKVDSNVLIGLTGCPTSSDSNVSWALVAAYSVITVHVLLALPVPFHACTEMLEGALGIREKALEASAKGTLWRVPPRLGLLGACTALAYSLPFFGALLDVVAAVAGQSTVFILPVVFAIIIQRKRGEPIPASQWAAGLLCLLVGVAGTITGLYFGLKELQSALEQT